MKNNEIATKIIEYLGGWKNINTFTHCATRLRFDIKDDTLIKEDQLNEMKEILGIVNKGGQYQLVIGPAVVTLYNEITSLSNGENEVQESSQQEVKKESIFNSILSYISGAIQPTLPVLIGAGMVNAILSIAVVCGMSKEAGTYVTLSTLANVGFAYLPVFVAYSAAKKMKTNEYIAAFLALAMIVCFNQKESLFLFGLAIPNVKYANSIIPALLMVPVQYVIEAYGMKMVPSAAHFTVKPLVLTLVMAPLILFVFGPFGAFVGTCLAEMCIWLMNTVGSLSMAVLSGLHAVTVMFGVHYLFTPIMTNEIAETGTTFVLCRALAANFAMAGAALAVGFKAKKSINKSVGFSSSVTALLSVTEPALFGCLIRLKRPLVASCGAAAITGLFIGIFQIKAYAIASPCLFSMPIFIGGDGMGNFFLACIAAIMAFGLSFVFTWMLGFKED